MIKHLAPCIVLLSFLAFARPGFASFIRFDTRCSSSFSGGQAETAVTVINRGDEPALSVCVEAILGDTSVRSAVRPRLEPGQSFRSTNSLGRIPTAPGIYTVAFKIRYTDGNGHPFTALESVPLVTTTRLEPGKPPLTVTFPPARLRKNGSCRLTLTAGAVPATATLTLVLPDEIESTNRCARVSLPAGGTTDARFDLVNRDGLPGSTYTILAVLDSIDNGVHRSEAIRGTLRIEPSWWKIHGRAVLLVLFLVCLAVFAALQFFPQPRRVTDVRAALDRLWPPAGETLTVGAILIVLLRFTLFHIPPSLLGMDTLLVGGDTPAHNYLASHLKEQLFSHGRIVSWAGGWWCGFPMFQFYFPLPYLLMALLSAVLPFNVAVKLVSVLGILSLPAAGWGFARILRFPRPIPELMAVVMIPVLFTREHVMWGVNIYSTFAGMIANSISFPIMLLFIACAWRDAVEGRARLRSVFLLVLLVASHFFTSLIAGLVLLLAPLLQPKGARLRALGVLAAEAGLGFLLMAWWLVPLAAKLDYSVDFGKDWPIRLCQKIPAHVFWLYPAILAAPAVALIRRDLRPTFLLAWMFLLSAGLFVFGSRLAAVFDNVRQWPFLHFALLALASVGLGALLCARRAWGWAVAAALIASLTWGIGIPNQVKAWATWNYSGLENKPGWPAFQALVLPLKGTPGRLANDSHHDNNLFGSDRVFEAVPHLIGKPIIEGGIVNSAYGALFPYYIQGETSRSSAGYPNLMEPASFDMTTATKHLELFNVKHFVACWDKTREALAQSPAWRRIAAADRWDLFELTTHEGRYVVVPSNHPAAVRLPRRDTATARKLAGLRWLYTPESLDRFFAILDPTAPPPDPTQPVLEWEAYQAYLAARRAGNEAFAARAIPQDKRRVRDEEVTDNSIRFRTEAIGLPHIVKCTYYPNWKVRGAKAVHLVTPGFMLVYPEREEVELYYGYTLSDNAGRLLTLLGLAVAAGWVVRRLRTGKRHERIPGPSPQVP